jgi:hypothetical protein
MVLKKDCSVMPARSGLDLEILVYFFYRPDPEILFLKTTQNKIFMSLTLS